MLNRITVMGRLVRDPELRRTQNDIPVCSFSVACDRDVKDKATGERSTDFIDGRLQLRDWTDREGNKRRSAEVIAEHIYFGDSKREDGCNTYPDNGYAGSATGNDGFGEIGEEDGELPF